MVKPWTSDQARDNRRGLIERQRLLLDMLLTAGADRACQSGERGAGGVVQGRPRHIETLGAEHQPVHSRMRLRITDIGLGAGHRILQRRSARDVRGRHRGVELPEADRGEIADKTGEIAEMMRRRGMRDPRLARHRAQRQSRQPVAFEHTLGALSNASRSAP